MQKDYSATTPGKIVVSQIAPKDIRDGVLVLTGYGLRVSVERGHLSVADGVGRSRRAGTLNRATCGLRRLVVLGHAGTVSLEALRWLHHVGAAFVQIDADASVVACHAPVGLDDARLRRAQALAATNGVGFAIAREIIGEKLSAQAGLLGSLPGAEQARDIVLDLQARVFGEETVDATRLRSLESRAALAYWSAWGNVPLRFGTKDRTRVPLHWTNFGGRRSLVTGNNRAASNPANAVLNYCYALLEAEARIACLAVGLDPGMGVMHHDQKSRDSLALDLMEVGRPAVDAFVLDLLRTRTFASGDFLETGEGVVRVMPSLTLLLAARLRPMAASMASWAERIARELAAGAKSSTRIDTPTKLTESNRSASRPPGKDAKRERMADNGLPNACKGCGLVLEDQGRRYCDDCLPEFRREVAKPYCEAGPKRLAELREEGNDPAHGGAAGKQRGRKNASHESANREWDAEPHPELDNVEFERDILPGIQGVPLSTIMERTGLSLRYCSLIRRGMYVPHQRHWGNLIAAAT